MALMVQANPAARAAGFFKIAQHQHVAAVHRLVDDVVVHALPLTSGQALQALAGFLQAFGDFGCVKGKG